MNYIKRIVDKEIENKLSVSGAVLIKGPKWCGKTTSAERFSKTIIEMQNPDYEDNYKELADTKPSVLLTGEKPLLIDEWQIVPKLWNAVRYAVDKSGKTGEYILTGSATPIEDPSLHSGIGRFSIIKMKPFTLYESGDSNGLISLKDILNGKRNVDGVKTDLTYEKIAYVLTRGGWPNSVISNTENAENIVKNYIDVLCDSDISRVDGVKRDPNLARAILKSYARQISTIDSNQALIDDVKANYADVSDKTIIDYVNTLKKLYIIDEIEAWNPNIRSKTSIRTSPKKSMIDPSLAVAVLDSTPKDLMLDIKTFGLFFENLVNRDLSVYVNSIGGYLKHYRDRYGLECDNVIHFDNGKYALVEVKLGGKGIKEAERHLLELKRIIDESESKLESPEFLMVITGTDIAYVTENNVLVVPIGCLKD